MIVITRKMKHRAANDRVHARVRKRVGFQRFGPKMITLQIGRERSCELLRMLDGRGIRIDTVQLVAFLKKVEEITPLTAPRVQDRHPWSDTLAQDLVEQIDVDGAELIAY